MAHWILPSPTMAYEMFHRLRKGRVKAELVFGKEELERLLRYADYLPFYIPRMVEIAYSPFTRVDVRRMARERVLSHEDVIECYMDIGYNKERAEKLALWTRTYNALVSLRARYRKGWLTDEQFLDELKALRLPEDRVKEIYEEEIKKEKPERLGKERELTKAEIVKGVKTEVINWEDGIELLKGLGYDEWEAEFILSIHIAVEGSPENYEEFLDLVKKYRKGVGWKVPEITPRMKELRELIKKLRERIEEIERKGIPEGEIAPVRGELGELEAEYREELKKLIR